MTEHKGSIFTKSILGEIYQHRVVSHVCLERKLEKDGEFTCKVSGAKAAETNLARARPRHHRSRITLHRAATFNAPSPTHSHLELSIAQQHSIQVAMAGPKYQNIPQRDSFEESSHSQAPPTYQAEDPQQALLRGVPRGEDDNLPDDFKFGGVVAEATLDIRMAFIRKVYAIL